MDFYNAFEWMKMGYPIKHPDRDDEWRLTNNRIEIVSKDKSVKHLGDFEDDVIVMDQILSHEWELVLDKKVNTCQTK